MRRSLRVRVTLSGAIAIALGMSVIGPTSAATVTVVASGLDNPRGIDVAANGRVYFAEAGAGRIAVIDRGTIKTVLGGLPALTSPEGETTGVVNVDAHANGNVVAAIGGGPQDVDARFDTVLRVTPGHSRVLANIQTYRNSRPEPACDPNGNPVAWCDLDQPPLPLDSNAYGVAYLDGAETFVTDAAGNDLLLIGPSGKVTTVARFPNHLVGTAHLPPFLQIPPDIQLPAEPVPTSVTVGPDGWLYVGELTGFPFTPGASRIWRVDPRARNVTCSAASTSGPCTVYATGFTSIIDLDWGPDGALYVAEMVHNGVGNLFFGSPDVVGAIWRVQGGSRTQLAPGQLILVGGVAAAKGALYATTFDVSPDSGQVVRISG
jgi:hypothetical protein